ncbi:CotH kinase family protein, partial [candidate division KSB1 bacterium]|nr:CotH kinase family protein [candidate division KSB1 bacterium]
MVSKISNRLFYAMGFLLSFFCLLLAQNEDVVLHFDPDRGFYESNFDLTLSTTPPGLTVRYTKDGTDPTTSSTAIQGTSPITVPVNPANTDGRDLAPGFFVRAVAIQADTAATKVKTHTYIFANRVVELSPDGQRPGTGWLRENFGGGQNISYGMDPQVCNNPLYRDKIVDALLDIPTFSMVLDLKDLFDPRTGIYVNALEHGREWERPCSIELIYPDGTDGFQINCGVRIRGGWSRNDSNPKRAFRWFFRDEYGEPKLRYPLFEDEGIAEFDNVDLRTSMNYSWSYGAEDPSKNTMNRDVFSRDMQRDMGQPYTRSRYYHLYINGTYWGLYQTEERPEASYAASYFGGINEDYDVIKVDAGYMGPFDIEATDGTLDAWKRLWDAAVAGFQTNEAYYKVQGLNPDGTRNLNYEVLLNVDNLIDFMLTIFLTGEADGPVSGFRGNREPNNFYAIYNRYGDTGFIFIRHDAEHTLGAQPFGYDRTGPFPGGDIFKESNPQWIFQKLCENPQFVSRIADRVYLHFFKNGALTPQANIDRFLFRKEQIDLAIIAESARWGDSKREPAYTRDGAWLTEIDYIVEQFFPDRTDIVLGQLQSKGWYPRTDPPAFSSESGLVPKDYQLTMSAPRGQIYYTTDGTDPYQPLEASTSYTSLIAENSAKKIMVPAAAIPNAWRQSLEFDDSAWRSGSGNIGYEQSQGYEGIIDIDVAADMVNSRTSCYVRIPFSVDETG